MVRSSRRGLISTSASTRTNRLMSRSCPRMRAWRLLGVSLEEPIQLLIRLEKALIIPESEGST